MNTKEAIENLIYRSCMIMDDKDFNGYLNLCDNDFSYAITAYSPEIKKEMIWLEHDKKGMQTLFNNLPRHNSDHSPINRHATVYSVEYDDAKKEANVITALQVFRTDLDGGATELFAVGKYKDIVTLKDGSPKLKRREVRLDTRGLGIGYHVPF